MDMGFYVLSDVVISIKRMSKNIGECVFCEFVGRCVYVEASVFIFLNFTKFTVEPGVVVDLINVGNLLESNDVIVLCEELNFHSKVNDVFENQQKIKFVNFFNGFVDEHLSRLSGRFLKKYIDVVISIDHGCESFIENIENTSMFILITFREICFIKNHTSFYSLTDTFLNKTILLVDGIYTDNLDFGYLDLLFNKSVFLVFKIHNILNAVVYSFVLYCSLIELGVIRLGNCNNFVIVGDFKTFKLITTYVDGKFVFDLREIIYAKNNFVGIKNHNTDKILQNNIVFVLYNYNAVVVNIFDQKFHANYYFYFVIQTGFQFDIDILIVVVLNRFGFDTKYIVGFIYALGVSSLVIVCIITDVSYRIITVVTNDRNIFFLINKIINFIGEIIISENNKNQFLKLGKFVLMINSDSFFLSRHCNEIAKQVLEIVLKLKSLFMAMLLMFIMIILNLTIGVKGFSYKTKGCSKPLLICKY